jgi:hypothetical protein
MQPIFRGQSLALFRFGRLLVCGKAKRHNRVPRIGQSEEERMNAFKIGDSGSVQRGISVR